MIDKDPYTTPLEEIDVGDFELFRTDAMWPWFERLRREAPVHYCRDSLFGPYWSISRFEDIVAIDSDHQTFSSDARLGGISIADVDPEFTMPMFIAMDPPAHAPRRKAVAPMFTAEHLARLESLIRSRAGSLLEAAPRGETFDWVEAIAVELTAQTLATLFDVPLEDRHRLIRWSNVAVVPGLVETEEQRRAELLECLTYFIDLWNARVNSEPGDDLISMMAHSPATRRMEPMEYLGNLLLLIVGGNDTTRSSITGGLYALNRFPAEYEKLRRDPSLIPNTVSEMIRWQTPLAHMRRTATRDVEVQGKLIRKGDKVIMWYVSGNRDEAVIARADELVIDRPNARHHLSFGFGIHRCLGNRLAELQLRILWEEILKRYLRIEVMEEPTRISSSFVKGYERMPVRIAG